MSTSVVSCDSRGEQNEATLLVPDASVPLSFAQERMWFMYQVEPDLPLYNIPLVMRLQGPLNVQALGRALQAVFSRHEVLRTIYHSVDGKPEPEVLEDALLRLPTVDLTSGGSGVDREAQLRQRINEHVRRPFNLSRDLMIRAALFRLGPEEHVLSLVIHHIAADGWSLDVLFRELAASYAAFLDGHESPLAELPVQYADYAIWQRQHLRGETLDAQLEYWRQQLAGAPPTLDLPTDRARPAIQTFDGELLQTELPASLCDKLKVLSRQEGVTLFTTLLTAFQVLLARYTGQEDVVVGSPVAGRNSAEVEGLIGLFVNTLVLRTDVSGNPSFRQLLRRVHETTLDAYDNQQVPLEKLVEELQPQRDPSRNPLFQVMFSLQNTPRSELQLSGLRVQRMITETRTAKCDLTVTMIESAQGLKVNLAYNINLLDRSTVERLSRHWTTLLVAVARDADLPISDVPLMTDEQRRQVVNLWNNTSTDYPRDASLPELFESQVAQSPDAVAVASDAHRLSYADLNARANRLARFLVKKGIGRGTPVATCLERSPEFVVALLAILKSGGAYMPLDPSYPPERLRFMLEDSGAPLVLTEPSCAKAIVDFTGQVVHLDHHVEELNGFADTNPSSAGDGGDLAYVMYTSGSTGRPKGTAIPQRAVGRLVLNTDYVQLTPSDVVAQASNCSFDAATFEIWGALLNGARLELVTQDTLLSAQRLKAKIETAGITTLFVTTALLNQLVEQAPDVFQRLTHLLFGGEAVTPRYVRELLDGHAPKRLLHVYGPTETTTFATWYLVKDVAADATTIPIGRPIANTTAYILDRCQNPVPVGVAGEVYIGGDGVARGYWNRTELAEQRFVLDPFSDKSEPRLYRTGDLARWLPSGSIEFLGRLDSQVKLRGFRIEPGEIEEALRQRPDVDQCLVTLREDRPGHKRLVAYVVTERQPGPSASELRHFAEDSLPAYMVPSAFVSLNAFPLTVNGKVDRKALPAPSDDQAVTRRSYVAPKTSVERRLASIWACTLGLKQVGIHDDFFQLGGHSLLGVQLFARIEKEYGKNLPLTTLFHTPTVHALAQVLNEPERPELRSPLVPIQPQGSRVPFFGIHGGGGTPMFYRDVALAGGLDQPFYGIGQAYRKPWQLPPRCVEEMVADHLPVIRKQQPSGPYFLGGYSFGGLLAFEIAQQLVAQGEHVALLAIFDTMLPRIQELTYGLTHRFFRRYHTVSKSTRRPLFQLLYYLFGRSSYPIPFRVSDFCGLDANRCAARAYAPKPYPGRITFFRASKSKTNALEGWADLAGGGLEVVDIDKRHGDMFGGDTKEFAAAFKSCLDTAQALVQCAESAQLPAA